jgi:hypothetical protein
MNSTQPQEALLALVMRRLTDLEKQVSGLTHENIELRTEIKRVKQDYVLQERVVDTNQLITSDIFELSQRIDQATLYIQQHSEVVWELQTDLTKFKQECGVNVVDANKLITRNICELSQCIDIHNERFERVYDRISAVEDNVGQHFETSTILRTAVNAGEIDTMSIESAMQVVEQNADEVTGRVIQTQI